MSEPGRLFIAGMRVVPKKTLSKAVRRLAGVRSQMAVRRFAARYGLNMDEAEKPLDEYSSILDLFTRKLKPGLRPVDPDPNTLVSPVDGALLVAGEVGDGQLYQAKGRTFSLTALLAGGDAEFAQGSYATVYLAPTDYHRIHAPAAGKILGYSYVPGQLFPVNPAAVAHVDQLFARNERLITHLDTEAFGRVDVVKVGATNVGHITVSYDNTVATNVGGTEVVHKTYDTPIDVAKGGELGVFEMGSTVILVVQARVGFVPWSAHDAVRLGRPLARLEPTS